MQAVEQILNRVMGLEVSSIGAPAVARAVNGRLAVRGLRDVAAYAELLDASSEELQALIEAIVVPETWFFRDREAFAALAALAVQRRLAAPAGPPLRLLSLPCSTGEEPYSMAMTLLEAGLTPDRFAIDAFDISARALERARAGVYGRNSFRGADQSFRDRHFTSGPDGWRPGEAVRTAVRFRQTNLFAVDRPAEAETYDAVFCRNLLIYFDAEAQRRAIEILRRLLAAHGLLFVGPGEANLLLAADFESARIPLAFAFRKAAAAQPAAKPGRPVQPTTLKPAARAPRRRLLARVAGPAPAAAPAAPVRAAGPNIADVRRLADLGQLAEAAALCETMLRAGEASGEAWRLLGLVRDAGGDLAGAADCYRKALYLDPADAEALSHLSLLLQRQGDVAGARLVSNRAQRLAARETA